MDNMAVVGEDDGLTIIDR